MGQSGQRGLEATFFDDPASEALRITSPAGKTLESPVRASRKADELRRVYPEAIFKNTKIKQLQLSKNQGQRRMQEQKMVDRGSGGDPGGQRADLEDEICDIRVELNEKTPPSGATRSLRSTSRKGKTLQVHGAKPVVIQKGPKAKDGGRHSELTDERRSQTLKSKASQPAATSIHSVVMFSSLAQHRDNYGLGGADPTALNRDLTASPPVMGSQKLADRLRLGSHRRYSKVDDEYNPSTRRGETLK